MHLLSAKRFILIGFIVVLLAAIPLTVYLAQKQQETRSKAQPTAGIAFRIDSQSSQGSPITVATGDNLILPMWVYPTGNAIVYVGVTIKYDSAKLALDQSIEAIPCGVEKLNNLFQVLSPPNCSTAGTITAAWIITDPNQALTTDAIIANFHFLPIAPTDANSPIQISFDTLNTTVASKVSGYSPENNSLGTNINPAWIAITGAPISPTGPTVTGGPTATSVPGATATPTTIGTGNPVCTALNVDRTPAGNAPFTIALTANGNDPNGTISKVSFDFGDGPVQNVTQSGGVGTNSVSVQVNHTYQNAGSYKATATLTDNTNLLSDPTTCTQTITVSQVTPTQAGGGGGGPIYVTATPTVTPTGGAATPTQVAGATETPITTAIPTTVALKPGPNDNIVGIGTAGIITAIIGTLIFFAL